MTLSLLKVSFQAVKRRLCKQAFTNQQLVKYKAVSLIKVHTHTLLVYNQYTVYFTQSILSTRNNGHIDRIRF